MNKFLLSLILLLPAVSNAGTTAETTGTINTIRTISQYNESVLDGQQEVIFKVGVLNSSCDWLAVKTTDSAYISALLSAQSQNKTVTVWYYTDIMSPIGARVCKAKNLELKQ